MIPPQAQASLSHHHHSVLTTMDHLFASAWCRISALQEIPDPQFLLLVSYWPCAMCPDTGSPLGNMNSKL